MSGFVLPQVFLVGETRIVREGMQAFLHALGVGTWTTDAASDAEVLIEVMGKLCYLSFSTELNKNLTKTGTRTNEEYIQGGIVKTKHGSVIEHPSVSFIFLNVSRVFTHELVRHRAGTAFSQVSGRYVRMDKIEMFFPSILNAYDDMKGLWLRAMDSMEGWVREMEEMTKINSDKNMPMMFKKKLTSAFRRLIGNGQANHIGFTANHRALRHVIAMRTDSAAEEEIRIVFGKVFEIVRGRYPAIYKDAVVEWVDDLPQVKFGYEKV